MAAELQQRDRMGVFLNALDLAGAAVEVGTYEGGFAQQVLRDWWGREWFALDPWEMTPEFAIRHGGVDWDMAAARRAAEGVAAGETRLRLVTMGQPDEEAAVPPLVDAVYIDASHDTRSVVRDLETWWPRVRPGGLLAGHDYLDGWRASEDINAGVLFGVRSAVDWFARRERRVVAATQEPFPTWWFRKPIGCPAEILVVSASTEDVPWRELAIRNHQRYCRRHGYRYRHELLTDLSRPASWQKLGLVRESLREADWVLWIDADALFQRADRGLDEFWDGDAPFVWFKDQINGLNTGVFFTRRCDAAESFLNHWERRSELSPWRDHPWWENAAAMDLERQGELPGLILPSRLGNSYPHWPEHWEPGDFIVHFAGLRKATRMMFMEDFETRAELAFEDRGESHGRGACTAFASSGYGTGLDER